MAKRRLPPRRRKRLDEKELIERLDRAFSSGAYQSVIDQCERLAPSQGQSLEIAMRWGASLRLVGNPEAAAKKFEQLRQSVQLSEQPHEKRVAILNELSRAYFELERFKESSEILLSLTQQQAVNEGLIANLIMVLEADGQWDSAESQASRGVQLFPNSLTLWEKLAELHRRNERWPDAEVSYQKCRELDPAGAEHCRRLVTVYRHLNDVESEKLALADWLKLEPDNAVAKHMLAAMDATSEDAPARPEPGYIKQVFDEFSETFDEQLGSLGYQAPQVIADEIKRRLDAETEALEVLDVGCGTGLMAEFLKPYAARLMGIDLSEGMIAKAGTRPYDSLECAEMAEFMASQPKRFDLIVSADTFNYVGDLADVMHAAFDALRPSGLLFFSVEKHSGADLPRGFALNSNGRYSHTERFVEDSLHQVGFISIECHEAMIREEAGNPVEGYYWSAAVPR